MRKEKIRKNRRKACACDISTVSPKQKKSYDARKIDS